MFMGSPYGSYVWVTRWGKCAAVRENNLIRDDPDFLTFFLYPVQRREVMGRADAAQKLVEQVAVAVRKPLIGFPQASGAQAGG
jgi:predicted acyltransferase (DUF342 family)